MRTRGFLFLVGMISVVALSAPACTPSDSDDDDDGFGTTGTPTPTGTATPTPTPTATPPAQDITERTSFFAAGGGEMWLCLEHQFAGTIDNIETTDGVGCAGLYVGVGVPSTVEVPSYAAVLFEGLAGCDTGDQDWYIDYTIDDNARCTSGCVAQHDFTLASNSTFGTFCGPASLGDGSTLVTSLSAYLSETTGEHRFTANIGPDETVTITGLRLYDVDGTAFLTDCTATATIISNGTGLFDTTCDPDDVVLTSGVTYSALVFAKISDTAEFVTRVDFDYADTPAPN